jgi:hypothetical protein
MKRPPEYYTLWNQAVEAVEIYLARNPRELDQDQIESTIKTVFNVFYHTTTEAFPGHVNNPSGQDEQLLVEAALP